MTEYGKIYDNSFRCRICQQLLPNICEAPDVKDLCIGCRYPVELFEKHPELEESIPEVSIENGNQLLIRINRALETIDGYQGNLHPESYRELLQDLSVIKVNIMQIKSLIDDSVLHRLNSLKELFGMINGLID